MVNNALAMGKWISNESTIISNKQKLISVYTKLKKYACKCSVYSKTLPTILTLKKNDKKY